MHFDVKGVAKHKIYNLVIGVTAPRPIALVTSLDGQGRINAAPFSSYNYLALDPVIVGIGISNKEGRLGLKDTALNIRETGEFVVNVVTENIFEAMNVCAIDFPKGESELEAAGLTTEPSQKVSPPRIREARAALECREYMTIQIGTSSIVLGEVLSIYVEDRFIDPKGPYVLTEELGQIGRMNGGGRYVRTKDAFLHLARIAYADWKKK